MRKQLQKIAKRSNDKKSRTPPVHGNHSALQQLPVSHNETIIIEEFYCLIGRIIYREKLRFC